MRSKGGSSGNGQRERQGAVVVTAVAVVGAAVAVTVAWAVAGVKAGAAKSEAGTEQQ